jgi:hypothetical protein
MYNRFVGVAREVKHFHRGMPRREEEGDLAAAQLRHHHAAARGGPIGDGRAGPVGDERCRRRGASPRAGRLVAGNPCWTQLRASCETPDHLRAPTVATLLSGAIRGTPVVTQRDGHAVLESPRAAGPPPDVGARQRSTCSLGGAFCCNVRSWSRLLDASAVQCPGRVRCGGLGPERGRAMIPRGCTGSRRVP